LPNSLGFHHRYIASLLNGFFKTRSFELIWKPKDISGDMRVKETPLREEYSTGRDQLTTIYQDQGEA